MMLLRASSKPLTDRGVENELLYGVNIRVCSENVKPEQATAALRDGLQSTPSAARSISKTVGHIPQGLPMTLPFEPQGSIRAAKLCIALHCHPRQVIARMA
ncbi:hypothetical protein NKDENANG_00306 [Candidatus Entotheonellaceae bacterium PAL068K]